MPETAWQEASWVNNLKISENMVDSNFGGIFVGLIRPNNLGSGQFLNHANVSILGNLVVNASYAPIMVTSTEGVIIGNNTIKDCLCQPPPYGQGFTCVFSPLKWAINNMLLLTAIYCGGQFCK